STGPSLGSRAGRGGGGPRTLAHPLKRRPLCQLSYTPRTSVHDNRAARHLDRGRGDHGTCCSHPRACQLVTPGARVNLRAADLGGPFPLGGKSGGPIVKRVLACAALAVVLLAAPAAAQQYPPA